MALRYYPAILERGPAGTGIGVFFPDLPGCASHGEDEQHAAVRAVEALALHVEGMVETGESLPEPSALNAPLPDWVAEDGVEEAGRVLIPVEPPGRAVRINITLDEGLLARLDRAAAAEGNTRSGFIAQAVRQRLREDGRVEARPRSPNDSAGSHGNGAS